VANYISEMKNKDDKVFVTNYHQIIYYLLGIESPTKYVHSNILFTETAQAFQVNPEKEIQRVLNLKPRFIIIQKPNTFIESRIKNQYRLIKHFYKGRIKLYERTTP
jgi:hypothetical protein